MGKIMTFSEWIKDRYSEGRAGGSQAYTQDQEIELYVDYRRKAENWLISGVSKRYKFTFKDEDDLIIIVHEDTERKAFKKAFRSYETPKNRELKIVSKEFNASKHEAKKRSLRSFE